MNWRIPTAFFLFMMMSALMGEGRGCEQQRHYVLVHGLRHGAWCWYKVQTLLQKAGQNVTSLDLSGAGIDRTDSSTVLAFEDYNKPLIDFLGSLTKDHKVILVGHSAGGLSLSHALHTFGPSKISATVFVGAIMLRSGFMTQEDIDIVFPNVSKGAKSDSGSKHNGSMPTKPGGAYAEFLRQTLYNESPEEDVTLAFALLRPAPYRAILAARFDGSTGEDVDGVPRIYVKTEHDRALKQEQQDAMIRRWPPTKVFSLNSDHSVFFSAPKQFVSNVLLTVGTRESEHETN